MVRNMVYRIHDVGRFTFGIDPSAKAGCYCPQAFLIMRRDRRPALRLQVTLPHLSFTTAFRLRRFGTLKLYALIGRLYYRMGRSPFRRQA
mgnify:CR=1 FL=1